MVCVVQVMLHSPSTYDTRRVDQNRLFTLYMNVYLVISLPKIPYRYIHHIYRVLASPRYSNPHCASHFSPPKCVAVHSHQRRLLNFSLKFLVQKAWLCTFFSDGCSTSNSNLLVHNAWLCTIMSDDCSTFHSNLLVQNAWLCTIMSDDCSTFHSNLLVQNARLCSSSLLLHDVSCAYIMQRLLCSSSLLLYDVLCTYVMQQLFCSSLLLHDVSCAYMNTSYILTRL